MSIPNQSRPVRRENQRGLVTTATTPWGGKRLHSRCETGGGSVPKAQPGLALVEEGGNFFSQSKRPSDLGHPKREG